MLGPLPKNRPAPKWDGRVIAEEGRDETVNILGRFVRQIEVLHAAIVRLNSAKTSE